jgi:hypothetical protein
LSRSEAGVYSLPSGSTAPWAVSSAGGAQTIGSSKFNEIMSDLVADANAARPVVAGGTGATTAAGARTNLGLVIGTDVQAYDADLSAIAALGYSARSMMVKTAAATWALVPSLAYGESLLNTTNEAAFKALVNLEIGVDVQAYDADTLLADTGDTLTAGYLSDSYNGGTVSSGTYTPAPATNQENFQHYTNGGAHTLAPPASVCAVVVEILNNGSAGAITTSGFTKVTGDAFTTTNGHKFLAHITKSNSYSHLHVTALQ